MASRSFWVASARSGSVRACEVIRSARASAITLSFSWDPFLGAAGGVLEQHQQEQRDDTGHRVNRDLPGFQIHPERQTGQPDNDDADAEEEERRLADPEVRRLHEPVEQ